MAAAAPAKAGGTWSLETSGTTTQLNEVSCADSSHCVAVGNVSGSAAVIVATTNGGSSWLAQTSSTGNKALNGVACPSSTNCLAVGATGVVIATTNGGTTWSSQTSGTTQNLNAVACVTTSNCWAVGGGGVLIATTNGGATWSTETSGTATQLNSISCADANHCVAVGNVSGSLGVIVATTNGGTSWSAQTSNGGKNNLSADWCSSATSCVAVGASGTVVATTSGGSTWSAQTSGTTQTLNSVACADASDCIAVGASGTIIATTNGGTSWSAQTSGTTNALTGVRFPTLLHGWAVGASGTIDAFLGCSGGSLGLTVPSSTVFPSLTLNGSSQTQTTTASITPDDESGAVAGWNLTAFGTTFTDGRGHTLAQPNVTAVSSAAGTGNCAMPTNSVTYPTPAFGTSSGTAVKIYNSASGAGAGPVNLAITFSESVPASQAIGTSSPDTFSSTWTFTLSTGP